MHRLRLSDGRGHTKEFESALPLLHSRLNHVFLQFYREFCGRRAVLEIYHEYHGWQPIYNDEGVCTQITNPLQIDYHALTRALTHTLATVSQWPSQAEQREKKAQALIKERAQEAQIRRAHFKLVPPSQPAK